MKPKYKKDNILIDSIDGQKILVIEANDNENYYIVTYLSLYTENK
jgi:hypothetical protein